MLRSRLKMLYIPQRLVGETAAPATDADAGAVAAAALEAAVAAVFVEVVSG